MIDKYVMVEDNRKLKVTKIVNISGTTWTDSNGNKYNEEKIKYIWEKRVPVYNDKYVNIHLLGE